MTAHLRRANRALLDAIETPPETGVEERLDRIAASIWWLRAQSAEADPGTLARLRRKLDAIEADLPARRAQHVRRARRLLGEYAEAECEDRDGGVPGEACESGVRDPSRPGGTNTFGQE